MASSSPVDPFAAAKRQALAFWPTPSPAFEKRLFAQMGLCAFLFVSTLVFVALYAFALRKQGKRFWFFRLIETRYGKYIVSNMYTVTVLPSLVSAGLIAGLLVDTREIFVQKGSQHNAMLWRTVIWIVVYAQGWFAASSGVTAAILISTEEKPFFLRPTFVNSVFIGGLVSVLVGIIIPGALCNKSWNFIVDRVNNVIAILDKASAEFKNEGVIDAEAIETATLLHKEIVTRSNKFFTEYLVMLVLWSIASFFLVAISLVGWSLVFRLRQQRKAAANAPTLLAVPGRGFLEKHLQSRKSGSTSAYADDSINGESTGDLGKYTMSNGVAFELQPTSFSPISVPAPSLGHERRGSDASVARATTATPQVPSQRAMTKLIRDLFVTSCGTSTLAVIFMADTILLAVKRRTTFQIWTTAETGMTLVTWSYLIVLCLCMIAVVINEILFIRGLEGSSPSATARSAYQCQSSTTSGVMVETVRQVYIDQPAISQTSTLDIESQRAPQTTRESLERSMAAAEVERRKSWRKPVPKISTLPTFELGADGRV